MWWSSSLSSSLFYQLHVQLIFSLCVCKRDREREREPGVEERKEERLCFCKSCVCVCVNVCMWLINCFCTLAWEPSLQEKASRWSLGISALWNALWTCWPPPPCHRHTQQSLVYCHNTHTHKGKKKKKNTLTLLSNGHIKETPCQVWTITRRQKNGFTVACLVG